MDEKIKLDSFSIMNKEKKGNNFAISVECLDVIEDQELSIYVKKFCLMSTVEEQLKYFKHLSQLYLVKTSDGKNLCGNFVKFAVNIFISTHPKNPLKNAVAQILSRAVHLKDVILKVLSEHLSSGILSVDCDLRLDNEVEKLKQFDETVGTVAIAMNFPLGQEAVAVHFTRTSVFLYHCLNDYFKGLETERAPSLREVLHQYVHNAVRTFVSLHQYCYPDMTLSCKETSDKFAEERRQTIAPLVKSLQNVLCNLLVVEDLPLDVGNTCALALVTFVSRENEKLWQELLHIAVSGKNSGNEFPRLSAPTVTTCINLCLGLLGGLSVAVLVLPLPEESVRCSPLAMILSVLLDLAQRKPCKPTLELGSSRGIQKVLCIIESVVTDNSVLNNMKALCVSDLQTALERSPSCDMSGNSKNEEIKFVTCELLINKSTDLLHVLFSQTEHFMDSVRHVARGSLQIYARVACALETKGEKCPSIEFLKTLCSLSPFRRARYIALSAVASGGPKRFAVGLLVDAGLIPTDFVKIIVSRDSSLRPHAASAFEALMNADSPVTNTSTELLQVWLRHWVEPILHALSSSVYVPSHSVLETLLAKAVKRYPSGIVKLVMEMFESDLKTDVSSAPGNLCALLVCLRAARIQGFFDSEVDTDILWKETLSFDILLNGAIHSSDEVKLGVLALIVDTHRSTEPPSAGELHVVRTVLEHTANSQVASTRQQCAALFKRLLSRLRNSATPAACRRQNNPAKVTELRISFLDWTVKFSIENLFPGANFGRRCFSLQMLKLLVEELRHDVPTQLWLPNNGSVLLEMLKDSYEENKCVALFILKHFPTSSLKFNDANFVYSLLCACEELAKSVRPPSSSTAAYILLLISSFPSEAEVLSAVSKIELRFNLGTDLISSQTNGHYGLHYRILLIYLSILEQQVSLAQNNLIAAICTGPMYGVLLCIRLLLQDVDLCLVASNANWCSLIDCIIKCCYKATAAVEPIVNSSSPEGYIPMDAQRISDLLEDTGSELDDQQHCDVTAQQVLLCAWRTVKESSLVMGWLAKQAPLKQSGGFTTSGLLDAQQLLVMGQHFTRLLSEIKHRGAFEQVYVGFCQLCSRIWSLGDSAVERNGSLVIHELPIKWLDELLNLVLSAEDDSSVRLCSTRRSAGVPFLVQALLATEPSAVECSPIFQRCMDRLFDMAEGQSSSDTRTHALNILRAIFRCADLREPSVSYVARGVMVAVYCCRAETWSERNAATLLFSTLLVRLFGVGRPGNRLRRTTGRVFFHQYPSLYDFLLHEISSLSKGMTFNSSYSMHQFPSLLLLSCLHPNSLEGADSNLQLSRFVPLVSAYAESNSEFTRKLAAQALAPIVSAGDWSELVDKLLSTASSPNTSLNLRHGIVLQVVSLLQTFSHQLAIDENLQKQSIKWLISSQSLLYISSYNCPCFLTAEAYIEVVQILINIFLSTSQSIFDAVCSENKKANNTFKSKTSNMLVCGTPIFENSCWSTIHRIITDEMKWLKESKMRPVEPGLCLYQMHASQLLLTLTNILSPENIIPFINEMLFSQTAVIVLTTLNFILNSLGYCSIRCPLEGDLEEIKNEHKLLDFPELASALVCSDSLAKSIASLFFMQKEMLLPDSRRVVFQLLPHLPLLIKHIGVILVKSLSKETKTSETTCGEEKCGELVLQWLLQQLGNDSQSAGPSVIALLGAFLLSSIEVNQVSKAGFSLTSSSLQRVCSTLQSTSSSECSVALRLSVAQVMSSKSMSLLLLNPHKSGLSSLALCHLWTTAVMLLDDDSHEVRQQACCLVLHMPSSNGMPVSEKKARHLFVSNFVQCMTSYDHLSVAVTLTSWILQQLNLEDVNMTEEQLFDETETNSYGESVPLSCIASDSLKNLTQTFPSLSETPLEMFLCEWIANQCWNASFSNENIQPIPVLKKRNIIQPEWSTLSELVSSMEKYLSGLGATFVKANEYPPQVYSFLNPVLTYTSGVCQRLTLLQKALHLV